MLTIIRGATYNPFVLAPTLAVLAVVATGIQRAEATDQTAPTFRAESRLVLVSCSVLQQKQFVLDLTRNDFTITEDGAEQEIAIFDGPRLGDLARLPLELILLVDVSGTTVYTGLLTPAVVERIISRTGNHAGIAVYSFAKRCVRLCGPTRDPGLLSSAIARAFEQRHDGTYLYEAVSQVAAEVAAASRPSARVMVILSDADQNGPATADSAADAATRAGIRLFPILLRHDRTRRTGLVSPDRDSGEEVPGLTASGNWQDQQYLRMGERTGGRGMEPNEYLSSQGLVKLLDSIVAQLSSEYTVGYYRKDLAGKPRSHRVKVRLRSGIPGKLQGGERTLPRQRTRARP